LFRLSPFSFSMRAAAEGHYGAFDALFSRLRCHDAYAISPLLMLAAPRCAMMLIL
jgi:hypothetical protein